MRGSFFSYAGDPASIGAELAVLADLVAGGRLQPIVGLVADWQDIELLLRAMEAGEVAGKAVLTMSPQ
jgi:NADPH:quinone reductase-like Zn-dependent oxidoreductase